MSDSADHITPECLKFRLLLVLSCLMTVVSCLQNEMVESVDKIIQATISDALDSKVSMTETSDDAGLSLLWEYSDKLIVVGESVEIYTVTAVDGKTATFAGKEVKGNMFDVILSGSADYENRSYLSQCQTGVQATEHLEYDACLKGVNTYADIRFTQEWATEHGGELLQSGCLLLCFQLPVKATIVTQVKLYASSSVFYATNSESSPKSSGLVMDIVNGVVGVDRMVKIYLMTSMQESVIESGTSLRVTVETDKGTYYKDIVPGKVSIMPGKRNVIKLNSKNWKPVMEFRNFTFMTYNVGKFQKYKDRLGHYSYSEVADIIKYCSADIVGLNEVESTGLNNQPERLTLEMGDGWNCHFIPASNDEYGNAVVASPELKAKNSTRIDLPCVTEGYQTRSLGVVEYDDFLFCVTHLDHHNRTNRAPQIKQINDWIKTNYGGYDKPIILVGDMNATPGSPEVNGTSTEFEGLGVYWHTISVTGTKPNYVVTYPDNSSCLDYIFLWKHDAVQYIVNKSEVIDTCPGINVSLVSDHYPVCTEITFLKKYAAEELKDNIKGGQCRVPDTLIYEEEI